MNCREGLIFVIFVMLSFIYRVVFVQKHEKKHEFCNVVGIKLLNFPEKKKLKDRLEAYNEQNNSEIKQKMRKNYAVEKLLESKTDEGHFKRTREFYVLGQNIALESISETADLLLKRDLNEVFNFDGETQIGTIKVPESYLPKNARVVNPDIAQDIREQFPKVPEDEQEKKLCGAIKQSVGDQVEKKVYEVLSSFYTNEKDQTVLIFQGILSIKSFHFIFLIF